MALTAEKRQKVAAALMRVWSKEGEIRTVEKSVIYASIDAADIWADNNKASYNSDLPAEAQAGFSAKQKADVLFGIIAAQSGRKIPMED